MRLSYSKLKTFSDFAFHYRLRHVERLKPKGGGFAPQNRLHRALRRFHQSAPKDGTVDAETLRSTFYTIAPISFMCAVASGFFCIASKSAFERHCA